ncbi:MAG: hypothetical protein OHK0045_23730 [Raineya sp.]
MKTYFSNQLFHFIVALSALSATLGIFIYVANSNKNVSHTGTSQTDSLKAEYFQIKESPISNSVVAPASTPDDKAPKLSILTEWNVKGWKLKCSIEPLLNTHERGKVVFRVKVNENGRLVALEVLNNLSNLSEENIQSFKTTIELEMEGCLERRKNVKVEPISNGTVTFFVNPL